MKKLIAILLILVSCAKDSPPSSGPIPTKPPPKPNPTSPLYGADVSHWDAPVDWPTLAKQIAFVFIKATEGTNDTDPDFTSSWAAAKASGITRGAFHYFHPDEDPIAQAKYFLNTAGLESGDMPPVLDLEEADGVSAANQVSEALQWLAYVQAATGAVPIIYIDPAFLKELGNPATFSTYILWQAEWDVSVPQPMPPWAVWDFWQVSGSTAIPGLPAPGDADEFNGSAADLEALLVK